MSAEDCERSVTADEKCMICQNFSNTSNVSTVFTVKCLWAASAGIQVKRT